MAQDAADKAHVDKVKETADGERLVAHSTYTEGDRALRAVQDEAEVERVAAYQEAGYVAAPGVGDYHATRRQAKVAGGLMAGVAGQGVADDPSAAVVDQVREAVNEDLKQASAARRAANRGGSGSPKGRRSRTDVMTGGGTGGIAPGGAGEGSGKSASSAGTDTTDRQMDASVGDQPANPKLEGIDPTGQDRPSTSSTGSASSTSTGSGSASSTGSGSASKPTKATGQTGRSARS